MTVSIGGVPHLNAPFKFIRGAADVVEQDTDEEVMACVSNIIHCTIGQRHDLPTFGIVSPIFANGPIDTQSIDRAITLWEPRARVQISESADPVDDSSRTIAIEILPQN